MASGTAGGTLRGREQEVRQLADLVAAARRGRGSTVVLEGEPGIGKSRLLAELAALADEAGFSIQVGRGEEILQGRPFGPLVEALGLRPEADDPDVALVGRILTGKEYLAPVGLPMASELRYRVLEAILQCVDRATALGPVLLVLDDLQWADEDTSFVLMALTRRAASLPLIVAAATRTHPRPPELSSALLAMADEGASVVKVAPLSADESIALVGDVLGAEPGPSMRAETARAGGNPFLVIELASGLAEDGLLVAEGGGLELREPGVPVGVQQTVRRRLAHLRPATLDLLGVATVLGRSFPFELLAAVSSEDHAALAPALAEALASGVLQEVGPELSFCHDLLRETMYESLPATVRSALHATAANALAEGGAGAFEVATQFERAGGGDDAADWLARGAEETRLTAPATSTAFLRKALEAIESGDPRRRVIEVRLADACVFAGLLDEGEARARACLDRSDLDAGLRREVGYTLGQSLFLQGRLTEAAAQLEACAVEGTPEYSEVLADSAFAHLLCGELDRAREVAERAGSVAVAADGAGGRPAALSALSWVVINSGDVEAGLEFGREAVACADATGSIEAHRGAPCLFYSQALLWADRDEEAIEVLDRAWDLGRRLGLVWDVPIQHLIRSRCLLRLGAWDDAVAESEAGLSASRELGSSIAEVWLHCIVARVAIMRRELEPAETRLVVIEQLLASGGQGAEQAYWLRALASEAAGDTQGASDLLGIIWDEMSARDLSFAKLDFAADLARIAWKIGDQARVDSVLASLDHIAERLPDLQAGLLSRRCRGIARRDPDALLAAVDALEGGRYGRRPVELAVVQMEAAVVLDEGGRGEEAERLRCLARPLLDELRIVPLLPSLDDAQGAEMPSGGRADRSGLLGWDALTGSERKVVSLVAAGLSNADIAEQLGCSRRTVESHLYHVYPKLHIGSRVELAVEAARRPELQVLRIP